MKHPADPNPRPRALRFGALSDPLHVQLQWTERRCTFPQRMADYVTHLHLHKFLTEREARAARVRIAKRIEWMWKHPGR